jgi:hypothetical protein
MNTEVLSPEAYVCANTVLQEEGVDPTTAFTDQEIQRHHYAVARSFQTDAERLRVLALAAYTDRTLGTSALQCIEATAEERDIAVDFDTDPRRAFVSMASVFTYIAELRQYARGQK